MFTRIRKAMDEKDQGFTLIELLVVMIIIGILAAIAIPTFMSQKTKARESSAKADVKAIATAVESILTDGNPTAVVGVTSTAGAFSIATTPVTTGRLSPGNTVGANSRMNVDGSYCVAVYPSDGVGSTWSVNDGQLTKAACPT